MNNCVNNLNEQKIPDNQFHGMKDFSLSVLTKTIRCLCQSASPLRKTWENRCRGCYKLVMQVEMWCSGKRRYVVTAKTSGTAEGGRNLKLLCRQSELGKRTDAKDVIDKISIDSAGLLTMRQNFLLWEGLRAQANHYCLRGIRSDCWKTRIVWNQCFSNWTLGEFQWSVF